MDLTSTPFSEEELRNTSLIGDGVSGIALQIMKTMRDHPDLLGDLSIFAVESANILARHKGLASPTLSDGSTAVSVVSVDSANTLVSPFFISEWEKAYYYYGISSDPPELMYRSDFKANPFPIPSGRFPDLPVKTVHGVFGTPLNAVWNTVVGPQVRDLLKARGVFYSAITTARFSIHENGQDRCGPVVIWIATYPGTTTAEKAHEVSPEILALLEKNGVSGVVTEWYEGAVEKLSGPPLLDVTTDANPTFFVRHFLTTALGMPITTKEREANDAQGSVAFFFHENRDKHGNPSPRVLGVSNHHVLREGNAADYEFSGTGAPPLLVQVAGAHRFERGITDIRVLAGGLGIEAELLVREIAELKLARPAKKKEMEEALEEKEAKLNKMKKNIGALEKFCKELNSQWSDIGRRDIGWLDWAPKKAVDIGGTRYTIDLGTFELDKARFQENFMGNVVDLGAKYTAGQLTNMFYPHNNVHKTVFKWPVNRQLRINGCLTREALLNPNGFDGNGEPCLIVMKYGNTSDLTVGRYTGLEAYLRYDLGVESTELAIYNYDKYSGPFAAKGDSGSLVFDGMGKMVGILHSGIPRGTTSHVTFATPAYFVIEKLKTKYPYADFNRESF